MKEKLREFLEDPLYVLAFGFMTLHMHRVMADATLERKMRKHRCRKCSRASCKNRI